MQNIKNIIFDLGGVILTLDMPATEKKLAEYGFTEYNTLFRSGNVSSFFKDFEVGKISNEDFVSELQKLTNENITNEQLINAWNAMLGIFPAERIDLLNILNGKYRLFLFSNTNALHVIDFKRKYFEAFGNDFDALFENAYYSNEIGLRKPDVSSFEHIIEQQNLNPAETLFIDDSQANLEGASKAGLQTIHITPTYSIMDIPF